MQKAARHSRYCVLILAFMFAGFVRTAEAAELKEGQIGTYRDAFDQTVYYEGTHFLRFDRLYRSIFNKKIRSENVNDFDEIPDNTFFTNRHGRARLSAAELERGAEPAGKPNANGNWLVLGGKFLDSQSGVLLIQDSAGDQYELRFDTFDQFELATSSEVIASRFYHAIGYHVPPYSIATFSFDKLVIDPKATVIDRSGFQKQLTAEKLKELMLFLPMNDRSEYRVSARKILKGIEKGNFKFYGRQKSDPNDTVDHENRREIRALKVFAAWLNHYTVNANNTLGLAVNENGRETLKYYLINFNTALGSDVNGAKPPMFSHEFLFDYGETEKAFLSLGIWEKPWQKRWREAGEKTHPSSAIGYFDNRRFDTGKFKPELPYYAFKDLTAADGFWAAKIIMSFSNDDIKAIIKSGELSQLDDQNYLLDILSNRRDLIGKHWFSQTNPLDNFKIENNALIFDDLAIQYGFETASDTLYHIDVLQKDGKKYKKISSFKSEKPSFDIGNLLSSDQPAKLLIRTSRKGSVKSGAKAVVKISAKGILKILHHG